MILLDTHIWVWLACQSPQLTPRLQQLIQQRESNGLAVSVISCWEVAKLVEKGRLKLHLPVSDWIAAAIARPHIELVSLTPEIAIEACNLPQPFHRDPADEMIVATARLMNLPLLTVDSKILAYPHVSLLS